METEMVFYPREGHGARETRHQLDRLERSIGWYTGHFPPPGAKVFTNVLPERCGAVARQTSDDGSASNRVIN